RIPFMLVSHACLMSCPDVARVAVALLPVGRPGVGCVARLLADDAVSEVAEAGAHASRSRGEVVRRLRSCAVASGEKPARAQKVEHGVARIGDRGGGSV